LKALKDVTVFFLCLLLLIYAGLWAKVWIDSRAYYLRGERFFGMAQLENEKSHYMEALSNYLESVRAYTPGSRYGRKSLRRAMAIAEQFDTGPDRSDALQVYLRIRSNLLSQCYLFQPYKEFLETAENRIGRSIKR
jgi:hypothetical protein